MAKKILNSCNVTKLDLINSEASKAFKDMPAGAEVRGAAIVEEIDEETGEAKRYSYLYTDSGVYAGISASIRRGIEEFIDLMADEPDKTYKATVEKRPSASGREFFAIYFAE